MLPGDGPVGDGDSEGAAFFFPTALAATHSDSEGAAGDVTGGGVAGDADGEAAVGDATISGSGDGGLTYPESTVRKPV